MIYIESANQDEIKIEEKEVLRYLGYGKNEPDPQMMEKIKAVKEEVKEALMPRACCMVLPITSSENGVDFGTFFAESRALSKNLAGCERVLFFAATIGSEVDRIVFRYGSVSPSSAVIAQAVCSAAIESFCDLLVCKFAQKLEKDGLFLRPRFSPGYGDFDLKHQKDIFGLLDINRKIGVFLTEGGLMTPTKSVTAVMGITNIDTQCKNSGCEVCEKRAECSFSRG